MKLTINAKTEAVKEFIARFEQESEPNPIGSDRIFHNTRVQCSAGLADNSVHIHSMESLERGAGGPALDALCKMADEIGVTLTGIALPFNKDHGISMQSLVKFYIQRGFTKTGMGDEKDGYRMVRHPKTKLKLSADQHIIKLAGFKERPH